MKHTMITIPNNKGVTADIFYATAKSTFTDYMNLGLKSNQTFEFTNIEDTIIIRQPDISEYDLYTLIFTDTAIILSKNEQVFQVPLFEERLIAFIHIAVD
ncbi:hypothetical protein ACSBL2_22535 [Pedobacter sp. AW31-3R]|uniref:hypothetical protein n=1 Tax=Pedobacter sp. AW31-3R TaxID=3445781 RepID=UPI003FA1680F